MSVSLKKATNKTNIKHNNRTMRDKEKERNSHIDSERSHENKYLIQKDLKELYQEEFSEALENYNAKQKRNDRKIDDYFKHIQSSKKTSLQQEMIIQVGDKDDFSSKADFEKANEILEEWFAGFEERNPNLKIYNAVIHNDEASPHMHLNFVPVAEGYKRGLEKQVSFDRAIIQQDSTLDKTRPFDDWREKEVKLLEKLLNERGFERKLVGKNEYKDVNEYKEKKDLQREIGQLEKELADKKNELLALNEKVPDEIEVQAKRQMKKVEVPTGEKNIFMFGKEKMKVEKQATGNVIVPEKEFQQLMTAAKENKRLKNNIKVYLQTDMAKENRKINEQITMIKSENQTLKRELRETKSENAALRYANESLEGRISDLKLEIEMLYQNTKAFLKERTDDFKGALRAFADKVKDKLPNSQFGRLQDADERQEKANSFSMSAIKEMDQEIKKQKTNKRKNRSWDMEL